MIQYPYNGITPSIDPTVYAAEGVVITGDVQVGAYASIWFNTVIRGDVAPTIIEREVNIQDQSMLHQSASYPLHIKEGASIGHQCMLHSCTIGTDSLIGMGSTILDGAEIGDNAFIGAGSLVPPGKTIPSNTLAFGRPAQVIRDLTADDYDEIARIRKSYVEKGQAYKEAQAAKRDRN
ncbi:gamma carbonic anhydrase family protein [Salisediminibacterium halotolerans]|uniref:gamma carbonic anhydrase n=1 Tax=Salisediminibacterium halotolerans TaxID=517425 RepID=UPI000F28D9CF|nr:carbonic anhydrase/acetyltransferase-like protein (isoleucine patch superfamily) [Actinophytocola xinjiangensis]RPE83943.1 carbonic anhydrase/acetyltransferase-like protein (isoleucine patch superfamily) [Salisediminibacterium halotolerans]TWG32506.1 carbonic anhydrase/acetyltransferase-like protein (isoleucine patch superfamily) [Salisediminibacterium halotolerans]GEL07653.1 gamma carbonic anhydrase family protein [Salisediminibacterium halotolerans]